MRSASLGSSFSPGRACGTERGSRIAPPCLGKSRLGSSTRDLADIDPNSPPINHRWETLGNPTLAERRRPERLWPKSSVDRRRMKGRRILVTGGAGFIGSHLVERLSRGNLVTVFDDLSTGSLRNLSDVREEVRVKRASILQSKTLATAMKGQELVYQLAAKTSVPESVAKPQDYWRANVEGTMHVLKAAVDAKMNRVVFASSAAVYGESDENPKVETMRPAPASPYATTKMVGEFACEEISSLKGIETVVVRIFNAYGPRQDPSSSYASVIAKFSAALAANQPVEVFGDGEQTRDFLFAGDLAEALELAGERPVAGQIFNVGSGTATKVNEVARLLSEITVTPIRAARKESRPGDVRHSRADISKATAKLGFTPRTSLREGLERTLAYYRTQVSKG